MRAAVRGRLGTELVIDPQPHDHVFGAGPVGHDVRHLRQDVLVRIRAADALGELRQDLVRGGPPAVHDAVGQPTGPLPRRLERDRHYGGRHRRQQRVLQRECGQPQREARHQENPAMRFAGRRDDRTKPTAGTARFTTCPKTSGKFHEFCRAGSECRPCTPAPARRRSSRPTRPRCSLPPIGRSGLSSVPPTLPASPGAEDPPHRSVARPGAGRQEVTRTGGSCRHPLPACLAWERPRAACSR
jgi:hypothetical protein